MIVDYDCLFSLQYYNKAYESLSFQEDESEIVGIDIEELNYAKLDGIKSLFDYRCMVSSGQRHIIYSSGVHTLAQFQKRRK